MLVYNETDSRAWGDVRHKVHPYARCVIAVGGEMPIGNCPVFKTLVGAL